MIRNCFFPFQMKHPGIMVTVSFSSSDSFRTISQEPPNHSLRRLKKPLACGHRLLTACHKREAWVAEKPYYITNCTCHWGRQRPRRPWRRTVYTTLMISLGFKVILPHSGMWEICTQTLTVYRSQSLIFNGLCRLLHSSIYFYKIEIL